MNVLKVFAAIFAVMVIVNLDDIYRWVRDWRRAHAVDALLRLKDAGPQGTCLLCGEDYDATSKTIVEVYNQHRRKCNPTTRPVAAWLTRKRRDEGLRF